MKVFRSQKGLNQLGFDHVFIGLAAVALFAVVGAAYIVSTHALTPLATMFTGTISY